MQHRRAPRKPSGSLWIWLVAGAVVIAALGLRVAFVSSERASQQAGDVERLRQGRQRIADDR